MAKKLKYMNEKKSNDPQIKFWGRGQGLEPGTRAKSGCRQ